MTRVANFSLLLIFLLLGLLLTPVSGGTVRRSVGAATSTAAPPATPAPAPGYAHPEWLIDPSWLQQHLHDREVKIVALTPAPNFKNGHIPGAAQIDWTELGLADTSDPAIAKWQGAMERTLAQLGITPSDTVVIYDGGTLYSARLWWILEELGHKDKRILNGGLTGWEKAGGDIEKGVSTAKPAATPYKGAPNRATLATLDDVKNSLGDPNVVLVDARTPGEYVQGHIPGAINIPFTDNAVPDKPRVWKSAAALRKMYEEAGITPDETVIAYCSTGVRSAATFFTLALIGYPHVTLYTGSWDEWSKHPELPTTIGKKP